MAAPDQNSTLITPEEILRLVGQRVNVYVAGVDVLLAEHLRFVGVTRADRFRVQVAALCMQNSDLHGRPHHIDLTVTFGANNQRQHQIVCSCKGGLGVCKHSMALLIYLSRKILADINEATCTEVTQIWGRLRRNSEAMYEAVPVQNFCHGVPNTKIQIRVQADVFSRANELVLKHAPNSELHKIREKRRTSLNASVAPDRNVIITSESCKLLLSAPIHPLLDDDYVFFVDMNRNEPTFTSLLDLNDAERAFFLNNVKIPLDEAVLVCLETVSQANRLWKKYRWPRVTASWAYAFISPWNRSTIEKIDWVTKVKKHFTSDFKGNAATNYGTRMEPRARECYSKKSNHNVLIAGLMINPAIPWFGCSLDGFVPEANRIIEIKCPYKYKDLPVCQMITKLDYIDASGENIKLRERHKFFCQVQLGMFITNTPRCDFIVYSAADNDCIVIPVQFQKDLVLHDYLPKLQDVYFKYMLPYLTQNAK